MTSSNESNNKKNKNSNDENNQNNKDMLDNIMKSKKPELAIVALLLSGKLKFDSVQLFREATLIVSLVGSFNKKDSDRVDQMVDFLDENGDMTIDDIFTAFKRKVND